MRDGRSILLLSVERYGSEHQLLQVKYRHIDWYLSSASFSNPNRMNTLAFPIYDDITHSNTTAVSPGWFRSSTKSAWYCLFVFNTRAKHAAAVTPQPMDFFFFFFFFKSGGWEASIAPASIDLNVAYSHI